MTYCLTGFGQIKIANNLVKLRYSQKNEKIKLEKKKIVNIIMSEVGHFEFWILNFFFGGGGG